MPGAEIAEPEYTVLFVINPNGMDFDECVEAISLPGNTGVTNRIIDVVINTGKLRSPYLELTRLH